MRQVAQAATGAVAVAVVAQEIHLGQHVDAALAVAQAGVSHRVVTAVAPAQFGAAVVAEGEAEAAAEFGVFVLAFHAPRLAARRSVAGQDAEATEQGGVAIQFDVRFGHAQQQVAAVVHPRQQLLDLRRRKRARVVEQQHGIAGLQLHGMQVQRTPGFGFHAIAAQGLAQCIQRVVGGFAVGRGVDVLAAAFEVAQEPQRCQGRQQQSERGEQGDAHARVHAGHP